MTDFLLPPGDLISDVLHSPPSLILILLGVVFLFLAIVGSLPKIDIPPLHAPWQRWSSASVGIFLLLIGLFLTLLPVIPSPSHTTRTTTPPPATPTPTPTAVVTFPPSLLPSGQPVINDPLKDDSQGYDWDTTDGCGFANGQYQLSAAARTEGVGCNPNAHGIFSNFVLQVQMTILTGPGSQAGPIFRANSAGQQYQVAFDDQGHWSIATDAKPLSGGTCASPCPYFHQGLGQPNVITIKASGSSIQIQINGYSLGSFTDSTYSTGYIGFQLTPGTASSSAEFSNLRVWNLS